MIIKMRGTDLAELYTLLGMYDRTYGGVPEELIGSVKEAYQGAYRSRKDEATKITNPGNAGRKSGVTKEKIRKAGEMHADGCSMREIAKEMHCSVGHVHKLIHERQGR